MKNLSIKSQFDSYEVHFCGLSELNIQESNTIIIDQNIWDLYRENFFFKKIENPILIDVSEAEKSLKAVESLATQLVARNVGREGHLLAIGGGITQEIVSFTASVYFRGISWSLIPTTLLSQADSCVGGKNSINISNLKNMLGTIHPPKKVIVISEFLETLDESEVISGEMEILKIHLLSGREEFEKYPTLSLEERIFNSLQLKKKIVEEDEQDSGLRWKLNLGHNFGHALEASSRNFVPHGVAVGFGILWGLELSKSFGHISDEDYQVVKGLIKGRLKSYPLPNFDKKIFLEAISRDKKNTDGQMNFILCTGLGQVELFSFALEKCEKIFNAAFSLRL